jgi:ABC-type nitrate/sulfonate/bicarbonate transport system permease component
MTAIPSAQRSRPAATRLRSRAVFEAVAPFLLIGVLLLAWQAASMLQLVIPFLLPPPVAVLRWLIDDLWSGTFFVNLGLTLYRTFAGFAIAAITGVAIGILMARLVPVRWFFDPVLSFGLPIPKLALLPVFMLWFGLYDASKIMMVAFSAAFQIAVSTWEGAHGVDKELVWSARAAGASEREVLREINLPAASPRVITGLQIALPVCLIVVLVAEMQMGGRGLGDAMLSAARYAKTAGVFAGIIEIGLVGLAVIKGMELLRRRLLAWHPETLREEPF